MKTAAIFTSKLGNTRAVAEYIAGRTGMDVFDLKKGAPDISPYERIVLGCGVYAGKLAGRMRKFIEATSFEGKDVQLFVCCKYNDEKGEKQLADLTKDMPFLSFKVFFSEKQKGDVTPEVQEFAKSLE